jgi:hypothetical protein
MTTNWGERQLGLLGLLVSMLVLLLGSGCGGGGASQESSASDTTTAAGGGGEQASEAALDAALQKSFQESEAPGVVAAVQTPEYTWIRALGGADTTSKAPMTPDVHHGSAASPRPSLSACCSKPRQTGSSL